MREEKSEVRSQKSEAGVKFLGQCKDTPEGPMALEYVPGIPARDLSAEEWEALSDEQKAEALATGLYEVAGDPRPRPLPLKGRGEQPKEGEA